MRNRSLVLVAALALSGMTLSAHHSVAAVYDTERLVTLVGIITRVTVANPHLTFDLKETSPDGTMTWTVEMAAPGAMKLRGFDPNMLKPGLQVVVVSWVAKDGRHEATARVLVMPDGQRFEQVGDGMGWSTSREGK